MNPLVIIIVIFIAAIFFLRNKRNFQRLFGSTPKPSVAELVETEEFSVMKPAGFTNTTGNSSLALELYSEQKAGAISIVDDRQVREEFNNAWAVVSVTPGNGIEICREVATKDSIEVLEESETSTGDEQSLTVSVVKKSALFQIETTHKIVFSSKRNKTYELRASVLTSKKAECAGSVQTILSSFQVN